MASSSNNCNFGSTKMFDRFFIFVHDFDPVESNNEPSLLCAYPSTENQVSSNELKQISKFCFPNGFCSVTNKNNNNVILDRFVFYMRLSNQKIYGCCVQFMVNSNSLPFFANTINRNYPFCICLLSRYPCISSHIRFLMKLTRILIGICKSKLDYIKITASWNVQGFCYPSMTFDKKYMSFAIKSGMRVPSYLVKELLQYQNCSYEKYVFNKLSEQQYLLYPTIHSLFSNLSIENIVLVYTAVLLERKVLIVSKDVEKYSSVVIAMNALCYPFLKALIVIPVVPPDYCTLLESPFPYIAGSSKYCSNADVIADLDNGIVLDNSNTPQILSHQKLCNKLSSLLEYEKETILIPRKKIKSFFGKEQINFQYLKFVANLHNESYPIAKLSKLKYAILSESADLINMVLLGHFFPYLSIISTLFNQQNLKKNFLNQTEVFQNMSDVDKCFFEELFSTQHGNSLLLNDYIDIYKNVSI